MFLAAFAVLVASVIVKSGPVFILELTAGLLVLLISFFFTEAAVYFLIFSMLLSPEIILAKSSQHDITLRMDDLLILIIAFGWLARNAVYKELGLFVKTPLNKPILYYSLACIFATLLGMLFGKVRPLTGTMFVLKYIEYFIIFFMVAGSIHSREQAKRYLIAMFVTLVIICVYSLLQIPSGERISAPFEGKEGEPNTLGGYLVFMVAVLTGLFFSYKSLKVRILSLALTALAAVPFLYTLSRSSWIALAGMYLAFVIFSRRMMALGVLLIIIILSAPLMIPEKVEQRYRGTFTAKPVESPQQVKVGGVYLDESTSARINSYIGILEDIKNRPIFGYGITGYGFTDGQYFRTLIETGFVGLATFFFLLCRVFSITLGVFRNTGDALFRGISLGMLAGLAALCFHALSANTFIIVRIMEPFWLVMGMVVAMPGITKSINQQTA